MMYCFTPASHVVPRAMPAVVVRAAHSGRGGRGGARAAAAPRRAGCALAAAWGLHLHTGYHVSSATVSFLYICTMRFCSVLY